MDIRKYCEYLYNSSFVPIYVYDNKELSFCYPAQDQDTHPPSVYLQSLWETDKTVTYTWTSFYTYFGCIQIENSSSCIVMGPVNDFPYSNDTLHVMKKEFCIENSNLETFSEFFHKIPQQNLDSFINTLLLINYTINNTELTRQDINQYAGFHYDTSISKTYIKKSFDEKETGILNNNYEVERELIRYIETGNIVKINQSLQGWSKNAKVGIMANNNLRQWKNTFIVLVTMVSRASMRGGLTPSIAYQLSEIYIQQVERLSDLDAIMSLVRQVELDFANRVSNSLAPAAADQIIHQVIQYVSENTNKHITVTDVADHVGYTRSSLSRKVKKELGIELSSLIRKYKMEEAKDLLAFSNKSISEISNDLCFSSQSHFQKAFKDYFKITPQSYRKSL
ncbi:AraC family transcriptional regulator [Neobacillus sp. 179-J 1A1 HS]|uniref:helix-turn-helix domain-containing protein n=1 Tax=Neobacillus driksii TaxID=3035913 RepID=UPI0035BC23DD